MDIRVYKTFLEIAKVRHFGKAAENLYITQAAVSARIKQLEEFYSAKLFIREKSNIRLTSAGERLLEHANAIVEQVVNSRLSISLCEHNQTLLNIAATPNIWDAYLANRIPQLIRDESDVSLGAEISVRESIHRKLLDKTLDIGILPDPIKEDELENISLGQFELTLVSTEPQSDNANYFLVDWGMAYLKEHKALHNFLPTLRTSTAKIALDLMLELGGTAYLPTELAATYIKDKKLFIVDTSMNISREVYFIYHKNNSLSVQLKDLVKRLKS